MDQRQDVRAAARPADFAADAPPEAVLERGPGEQFHVSDEIAAAFAGGRRARLEGDRGHARGDRRDRAGGLVDRAGHLHLVDDACALEVAADRHDAAFAQVEDPAVEGDAAGPRLA